VTAAAFAHADGGHSSPEIRLLQYIDRFGVEAVMGRKILYAHEMRRMIHAENVSRAYHARNRSDAAEWVKENPEMNKLLYDAQMLAEKDNAR